MKRWKVLILVTLFLLGGCQPSAVSSPSPAVTVVGFGCEDLPLPKNPSTPLYIAGYHNGREVTGVLDLQQVRALWLDDGTSATLLLSVDCVGLGSDTVGEIRRRLSDFCRQTQCDAVQVVSTHTHAGVDTLGLWGPIGVDGKNPEFMEILYDGAVKAAYEAYADRSVGTFFYSATETTGLQADSRAPAVWDNRLYQLRFVPDSSEKNGIRLFSFAAHAESLRSENTQVSRDYPGAVCDRLYCETGDDALYLPGAIGGLIMTPVFAHPFDAAENMAMTADRITTVLLHPANERQLSDGIFLCRESFEIPAENTVFMSYRFLGILKNGFRRDMGGQYHLQTELSLLGIGEVTLVLLPGEIFPELLSGTNRDGDPTGLRDLAAKAGVDTPLFVGLANDEVGYVLPPSAFRVDEELPYFRQAEGDHYEETNSVGPAAAAAIASAFQKALMRLSL